MCLRSRRLPPGGSFQFVELIAVATLSIIIILKRLAIIVKVVEDIEGTSTCYPRIHAPTFYCVEIPSARVITALSKHHQQHLKKTQRGLIICVQIVFLPTFDLFAPIRKVIIVGDSSKKKPASGRCLLG